MLFYCLKCKKHTESIDPKVLKTKNGRAITLSKCTIFGSKKSKFIKQQEGKGLLSNLGIKTPSSKITLLGDILFQKLSNHYKLYDIVNKFLLAGDKFMPETHLKHPGFTYMPVDHLLRIKKEFKILKKQEIQNIFTEMN